MDHHYGHLSGPVEYQYQAGFVPPPVSPPSYTSDGSEKSGYVSSQAGNYQDEDQKKMIRRQRNKAAAARCRQRRVDYTKKLEEETKELAEGNKYYRNQLKMLQDQREQLEKTLEMHQSQCQKS